MRALGYHVLAHPVASARVGAPVRLLIGISLFAACGDGDATLVRALTRPAPAALSLPASLEVAAPGWTVVEAFPAVTFDDPTSLGEAPSTGHLFVTEREGRIYALRNDPAVSTKILSLDLSDRTQGRSDGGLLSLTFHPEFGQAQSPNRSYVYVHYAYTAKPVPEPDRTTPSWSRLSRFSLDLETLVIDPSSELILIDQADESIWHQGGAAFFGPDDGFLYLTVGDEGMPYCALRNCQSIDKDLFSGVLRIDVDMRGGDVSHPIRRQPETGKTAHYFIPNDNPFVGQPGVLEEFFAIGLRSPHRMTHDAIDGITWIGDVGQARREELDVLQRGANFQWNVLEGSKGGAGLAMPAQPLGVWTDPTFELSRDSAAGIIGGYVYRGARFPSLYGKYVFGDYYYGSIWALSYSYDGSRATVSDVERLTSTEFREGSDGFTSFGVDGSGELYILTLGAESKVLRLDRTEGFSNTPLHLSETGVFVDTASAQLEPSPGFLPYDVITPLWSDGASKQRWLSLPDAAAIGFSETGSWSFPEGTVFVKQFDLALDEARPDERRRLETRLLVNGEGGYYAVTYRWNADGTDAELVLESSAEPIRVDLADGHQRELAYLFPGPDDCAVCHNPGAGSVLGARTAQLNHDVFYPQLGRSANQLLSLAAAGALDVTLKQRDLQHLPTYVSLADESAPLDARVRSYWASNCSMCHGSVPDIRADWDARYEVPLDRQGVIDAPSQNASEAGAFLVVPADPGHSVLFQRSATTARGLGMPPLGRSVPDPQYVDVLERWIRSLPPSAP
jgi:uncharacterized repeat protein (TIGR03806 family)